MKNNTAMLILILLLSACNNEETQFSPANNSPPYNARSASANNSALVILPLESVVTNLSALDAKKLLDNKVKSGLFVLNVHSPFEGKIEGTDLIIDDWQHINKSTEWLPKDHNTPILVYCRSGRMSTSAVVQLRDMGYTNLYHLDGGMKAWDAARLPLLDKTFK